MTHIREIAQLGNPVLRHPAEIVTDIDSSETQELIRVLQDTLASTQGVGIAAPQISVSRQIIIIASRPSTRYPHAPLMTPTVMINPRFKALSDDKEKDWEGCLSIPGIRALVPRYKNILITYTDTNGLLIETCLEGFVARIFQHEFDHLEGKVYLDNVVDNRDIFSESEYFKFIAQTN
ncbi:MAG: peptide deformylase [Methylococcales bacterium]|nr:MAG: peptide deformylase [Methylococcales bacterium]